MLYLDEILENTEISSKRTKLKEKDKSWIWRHSWKFDNHHKLSNKNIYWKTWKRWRNWWQWYLKKNHVFQVPLCYAAAKKISSISKTIRTDSKRLAFITSIHIRFNFRKKPCDKLNEAGLSPRVRMKKKFLVTSWFFSAKLSTPRTEYCPTLNEHWNKAGKKTHTFIKRCQSERREFLVFMQNQEKR